MPSSQRRPRRRVRRVVVLVVALAALAVLGCLVVGGLAARDARAHALDAQRAVADRQTELSLLADAAS
ncbi:hypothetical protein, partial [Angustibacter speluncae]